MGMEKAIKELNKEIRRVEILAAQVPPPGESRLGTEIWKNGVMMDLETALIAVRDKDELQIAVSLVQLKNITEIPT